MVIDVRIRWSHLDTDEEHFVVERVPLPKGELQRERQLRELTFLHHPNADQHSYHEGVASYVARPWLVVTTYEWGTEAKPEPAAATAGAANETLPLFRA